MFKIFGEQLLNGLCIGNTQLVLPVWAGEGSIFLTENRRIS